MFYSLLCIYRASAECDTDSEFYVLWYANYAYSFPCSPVTDMGTFGVTVHIYDTWYATPLANSSTSLPTVEPTYAAPTASPSAISPYRTSKWYTTYIYSDVDCQTLSYYFTYRDNVCVTVDPLSSYNSAMLIFDGAYLHPHLFTDSRCSEGEVTTTNTFGSSFGNLDTCMEGSYTTITDSLPSTTSESGSLYK